MIPIRCVSDYSLSENWDSLFCLHQGSLNAWAHLKGASVSQGQDWSYETQRGHPFCLRHVLFLCVHRWMHDLLLWHWAALGMGWQFDVTKENCLICSHSSMLFSFQWGFRLFFLIFQTNSGWKYGVSLDENMKTHPLIRPFKTLAEKVIEKISAASIWSRLTCMFLKIHFKYNLLNVKQKHKQELLQLIGAILYWSDFFS